MKRYDIEAQQIERDTAVVVPFPKRINITVTVTPYNAASFKARCDELAGEAQGPTPLSAIRELLRKNEYELRVSAPQRETA